MPDDKWTRRPTFPDSQDDWVVLRNGKPFGRLWAGKHGDGTRHWGWSVTNLHRLNISRSGEAPTYERAKQAMLAVFDEAVMACGLAIVERTLNTPSPWRKL